MSSLYPEMRFSWEIRSVDALFCNGMTRVGDLSREAILSSIRDEQVSKKMQLQIKIFCKAGMKSKVVAYQNFPPIVPYMV